MASAIFVNGPTLVSVKYAGGGSRTLSELGLAEKAIAISISPSWYNVQADDWANAGAFQGRVGPEVLAVTAEAIISMELIHFDRSVLDTVMVSLGGLNGTTGTLLAPGTPLGGGQALDSSSSSTYKYVSLNLSSPTAGKPWRFPATYLMQRPMEFPLGTEKSVVRLVWRAIPYGGASVGNPVAAGTRLWDHTADA